MSREADVLLAEKRHTWEKMMLVLAGSAFAKNGIQSTYDRFRRITDVSTKAVPVYLDCGGFFGGLALSFSYIRQRHTDSRHPDRVFAVFNASSLIGLYTKVHSVSFLADGARILPVEEETWDGYVTRADGRFYVHETIIASLNVADFVKIASAGRVEGEVGPTHFTVKNKQLELWQELAEKIVYRKLAA